MKILFLYSELAGYFISCLEALSEKGVEVHVVHWPVNKEAPFQLPPSNNIKFYNREKLTGAELEKLVYTISPQAIYCSGWIDKTYLKICKKYNTSIPVILGFDNKWNGTLKQRAAALFFRRLILSSFSHCWIPGKPQLEFAHKLGFKDNTILKGFYSCDFKCFNDSYLKYKEAKSTSFPHKFIFVGRYYDFKGIHELWDSFIELKEEFPNDWELWCLGTGTVNPKQHPAIKHFGFIQPSNMDEYIKTTGVYILPSHIEPWGVSVHEFASAGFPLICSDQVGSADAFLKESQNGFIFKSKNKNDLKLKMKAMVSLKDTELNEMGDKSVALAKQITPDTWTDTILAAIK